VSRILVTDGKSALDRAEIGADLAEIEPILRRAARTS